MTTSAFNFIGFLFSLPSGGPSVISVTLYIKLVASFWLYPKILSLSSSLIGSFKRFAASLVTSDLCAAVSAKIAIFLLCNGTSAASGLMAAKIAV